MTLRQAAENAPYHLTSQIEECSLNRFWVVELDNGLEVYEALDNAGFDEPNSWMRLKAFCLDYDIKIVNMSRVTKDLNPKTQIIMSTAADGYFYARRMRKLMTADPRYANYHDISCGIGELHGDILKIVWELDDGRVETEERDMNDHPKSQPVSLIRK